MKLTLRMTLTEAEAAVMQKIPDHFFTLKTLLITSGELIFQQGGKEVLSEIVVEGSPDVIWTSAEGLFSSKSGAA